MGKLSLVVADRDKDYLSKFERFLMLNYYHWFEVTSFSTAERLKEFLSERSKKDILLINKNMNEKELTLKNMETVIFFMENETDSVPEGFQSIAKYQHADKLVSEILRVFTAQNTRTYSVAGNSDTRIICVYSPAGGTGKSSIAAGLSVLSVKKGMRAFYLNQEVVPSTSVFFNGDSAQNYSRVIFYLKGKGKNLSLQIEGARSCDTRTGVHFFAPPDSIYDMEELSVGDISRLIAEFRENGIYDAVFVDMSSGLDHRNAALLGCADIILMVAGPDDTSAIKLKRFIEEIDILKQRYGVEPKGRAITIANKSVGAVDNMAINRSMPDGQRMVEIKDCQIRKTGRPCQDLMENMTFMAGLNRLLEYILPQKPQKPGKAYFHERSELVV